MVAGGDDHMAPELCQRGGQLLRRLAVDAVAVEQVARQQHQLYAVIIGVLHHAAGQIAALLPPLPGPLLIQAGEGAVQMKVRRVQNAYHLRFLGLPALAHVHPAHEVLAAAALQFVTV